MKIICMPSTVYALLNFLLIYDGDYKNVVFIVDYDYDKNIIKKIKSKGIVVEEMDFVKNQFKRMYYYFITAKKLIKKYGNIPIYGQDHKTYTWYFKNEMYLLEDGIGNYLEKEKINKLFELSFLKKIIYYIVTGKKIEVFGYGKKIKKIYLTGISDIPKDRKDKVEIINLQKLWNEKLNFQRKEILEIFGMSELLKNGKYEDKVLLLTQPFSEDFILSYEEEIEMYKKILSKYEEKNIIIKPHPREKKIYKEIFPNAQIMESKFPFELVKLNGILFEKVITVFSTAALNLSKEQKIEFLGTKVNQKLIDAYGEISIETFRKSL